MNSYPPTQGIATLNPGLGYATPLGSMAPQEHDIESARPAPPPTMESLAQIAIRRSGLQAAGETAWRSMPQSCPRAAPARTSSLTSPENRFNGRRQRADHSGELPVGSAEGWHEHNDVTDRPGENPLTRHGFADTDADALARVEGGPPAPVAHELDAGALFRAGTQSVGRSSSATASYW